MSASTLSQTELGVNPPTPLMSRIGFRARALDAYANEQKAKAAADIHAHDEKTEHTRARFIKRFEVTPAKVDGEYAELDGIKFVLFYHGDGYFNWHIVGKCPECGEDVMSLAVNDLSDVGEQLANFHPDYGHRHKGQSVPAPATLEARLAEVIREIVREEMGQ